MIPILSVVGRTNSGKTTLIEKLLPELRRRGFRVGTLKHDVHGFEMDKEGKDTWRHAKAGADAVGILSSSKCAVIKQLPEPMSLNRMVREHLQGVDLVLTEGFKQEDKPKIEVFRSAVCESLLCEPEELFALVSDVAHHGDVPTFALEDVAGLAGLIESSFLRDPLPTRPGYEGERMTLHVNGRPVGLTPFVQQFMANAIAGMIGTLRGVDRAESVRIEIHG